MGLRISTNIASMAASRALANSSTEQAKSFQRLATGNRVVNSADDSAGLSIAENLRAQIRSLGQAERNANDGISFIQVAEGGMNEISNMLVRMRELAIQGASDTVGDTERGFIDKEIQSLKQEVDRIANVTAFNGTPLLNGKAGKELHFHVGARKEDHIGWDPANYDVQAGKLGIDGLDYKSIDGARDAIDSIDKALAQVMGSRAELGANQNKLQSTINNLAISRENYSAARSRIMDTDLSTETSQLVRGNILQQAGIAVLGQANTAPSQALRLLG